MANVPLTRERIITRQRCKRNSPIRCGPLIREKKESRDRENSC